MSGIFEQLAGAAIKGLAGTQGGQGAGGGIQGLIMDMLTNPQSGGLQGLIGQFAKSGLGEVANSWVSTGQNMPISPHQLQGVFGAPQCQAMAQRAGLPLDQLLGGLSQQLPGLIDQLTPKGQMPQQADIGQMLTGLLGALGKR